MILCVLCCGLIFLTMATDMSTGPLKYVAGYVITPIQKGLNEVGNWIADRGNYFQDSVTLTSENQELRERVETLTSENSELLEDQEELQRLRELLDLSEEYSDYEKIGAKITARGTSNWFNVFTIDKGTNDGVQVDCNVIADGGLVESSRMWDLTGPPSAPLLMIPAMSAPWLQKLPIPASLPEISG